MRNLDTNRESGFTLIEILVASLLLGMLMTILTMVFNSSAIAWRTGRASNSKMSLARKQLSYAQRLADNALPRINRSGGTGRILSAWAFDENTKKQTVRERAVEESPRWTDWFDQGVGAAGQGCPPQNWGNNFNSLDNSIAPWAGVKNVEDLQNRRGRSYLIGVRSCGPDGVQDTADDINTMPVTVE